MTIFRLTFINDPDDEIGVDSQQIFADMEGRRDVRVGLICESASNGFKIELTLFFDGGPTKWGIKDISYLELGCPHGVTVSLSHDWFKGSSGKKPDEDPLASYLYAQEVFRFVIGRFIPAVEIAENEEAIKAMLLDRDGSVWLESDTEI